MPYPPYTSLIIDEIVIPDFASRGITVTLRPDPRSRQIATDVMGEEVDISLPRFRKRIVEISCTELEKPVFDDVWPGTEVNVTLIPGLGIGADDSAGSLSMVALVGDWQVSHEEWESRGTWTLELVEKYASN